VRESRTQAHGVARGSLPEAASKVRVAGAAEAIQSRGMAAEPPIANNGRLIAESGWGAGLAQTSSGTQFAS
jgi:hypothetical protein